MKSNTLGGNRVVGVMTLVLAVMLAGPAGATSATWNGTDSAIWATGGNWSATPVPGSGDTATFNNAGNANTTLNLGTGVSVSNLVFDIGTLYTIGSGANGSQSLTLNNGGSITVSSGYNVNHIFAAALTLGTDGSTQNYTFNLNNGQPAFKGGIIGSTGAGTKTIVIQGSGGGSGFGGFYNNTTGISDGAGGGKVGMTVNLTTTIPWTSDIANNMSGPLVFRRGTINFQGAVNNFANVTDITLGLDAWAAVSALPVVSFRNDIGNNQRVNASASVTAVGLARMNLRGHASLATTESIGTYTSLSGVSSIETALNHQGLAGSSTDPMVAWSIGNLVRSTGGGIVNLQGAQTETGAGQKLWQYNLGQGSGAGNAQITATTINGATPSSAMINGIIPWAILISNGDIAGTGRFATYGANGFKPYGYDATGAVNDNGGTEPFVTTIAAGTSTKNVLISGGETVNGTATINSLTMTGGGTIALGTGTPAIQLTSGALIATAGGTVNPKIDFQGREGIVYVSFLTLGGALQNDGGNGVSFSSSVPSLASYAIKLNAAGTWTGPTRVLNGALQVNAANILPNTALRVNAHAAVSIEGNNAVASLSGGGLIGTRTGGVNPVLTVGSDNTSTIFSGIIGNTNVANLFTSPNIGLTKVGTGTLTLTGINPYTGITTVSNGTLMVNGAITNTATVAVKNGAFLDGTGTIGGIVTVETNGTLTAGTTNTTGTLTLSSNLLLNAYSKLVCNITSSNDYDRIVVGGSTVNLNADSGAAGATLQLALGYAPKAGQQFTILTSGANITTVFANGSTIKASYGGATYTFSISTGDGDIVLTTMTSGTMLYIR